jgi:hypothetical protein
MELTSVVAAISVQYTDITDYGSVHSTGIAGGGGVLTYSCSGQFKVDTGIVGDGIDYVILTINVHSVQAWPRIELTYNM